MIYNRLSYITLGLLSFLPVLFFGSASALAGGVGVEAATDNLVTSVATLPGLITAISYALALIFGVTGVLKLKDHVDSRASSSGSAVPLRTPLIRFLAGGALLALPMVLEAARNAFGLPLASFGFSGQMDSVNDNIGTIANGTGLNVLMGNFANSLGTVPNLVSAIAYLLGLVACVAGVLKIKDHVENPDRVELKEGIIRLLIGGALFALPRIYSATFGSITGLDGGFAGVADVQSVLLTITPDAASYLRSGFGTDVGSTMQSCDNVIGSDPDGLGARICGFVQSTGATPAFLTALCYLFGIVVGLWALLKIRDHVLNPQQTPIWEGVSRLIVAGAFLSMPYIAGLIQQSITNGDAFYASGLNQMSGYHAVTCSGAGPQALDTAMACFMDDILAPAHILISHFAFIAGLVFIMIGITRIMKSAQEGARGPGGKGTIATFLIAGILLSYNNVLQFFNSSLGVVGQTDTFAELTYTTGMTAAEVTHANVVIQTVIQFMIIVGLISFVRGWFIIRDVAEGNQQASMMAGVTHILGGALAINLGPLLNAVQSTLGIAGVGIGFT